MKNIDIQIKIFSKVCVYSNKCSVFLIFSSKMFLNAKQVTQLGWSYWIERDVGQTQCWQIIYVSKSISSSSHANPSNVTSTKSPSGCTSVVADWPETSSLVHVSSGLVHFRLETSAGHAPTSSHSRMSGAILRCTFSTLAAYGKKVYKPTTSAKTDLLSAPLQRHGDPSHSFRQGLNMQNSLLYI